MALGSQVDGEWFLVNTDSFSLEWCFGELGKELLAGAETSCPSLTLDPSLLWFSGGFGFDLSSELMLVRAVTHCL